MFNIDKQTNKPLIIFFLIIISAFSLFGQNHPELEWFTFESEHFIYHYHKGTERTAQMALTIAEKVYPKVTDLYDWKPADKTHIIIQDTDDYANGGAYYFDNKILLWASPLEFDLRGNHNWIRDVFTHEFSHIISLGASMKYPISIPAGFIQVLDREKPIRDNIVLEYPKGIGVVPVPNVVVPMWWAEGVAQYQFSGSTNDIWDSHRDMILRDRTLNNNLLTWPEMFTFGKKGTGNESVYNTGLAFVRYLAKRYSPKIHKKITREAQKKTRLSFNKVFKRILGKDGKVIHKEWCDEITNTYKKQTQTIRKNIVKGKIIFSEGPSNFFPSYSPNGKRLIFTSSKGNDYIGQTNLYEFKKSRVEKIANKTRGNIVWSNDGKNLYYAKEQKPDKYGSVWFDLAKYNFKNDEEERLTTKARIYSVAVGPKNEIYLITVHDGSHNIQKYNEKNKKLTPLTDFNNGEQVFTIDVSPDGKKIIFDMALIHGRDIYSLDIKTKEIIPVVKDEDHDNRSPVASPDGKYIVFSSDRTGIFNLYKKYFNSDSVEILTNVTGGTFYPEINPKDGEICYSLFDNGTFKLAKLNSPKPIKPELTQYNKNYKMPSENYDPGNLKEFDSKPYEMTFSRMFFMPFVMWDYNAFKFGTVLYQSEILNKFDLFTSASINKRKDIDAYLSLEYKKLLPIIYAEGYFVTLHMDSESGRFNEFYGYKREIYFGLWDARLGVKYNWRKANDFDLHISHGQYSAHIKDDYTGSLQKFGYTYFKGTTIEFGYNGNFVKPMWRGNINPTSGFEIDMKIAYDINDFLYGFGINEDFGTLEQLYHNNNTMRLDLNTDIYLPVPLTDNVALNFNINSGWLENAKVDSFFNYFGGGMPGLKGYPFYSIEGTNKFIFTSMLRFPIVKNINLAFEPFKMNCIYLGIYHQIGNTWSGAITDFEPIQDVGTELRIGGNTFYSFPIALTFDVVYGLDKVHYDVFDGEEKKEKTVGQNFRFYWKILFEF
jgi:Tol biopolymer transport system component